MEPPRLAILLFGLIALSKLLISAGQHLMNAGVARILGGSLLEDLHAQLVFFLLVVCRAQVIQLVANRVVARQRRQAADSGIKLVLDQIDAAEVIRCQGCRIFGSQHLIEQRPGLRIVAKLEIADGELIAGLRQGSITA